MGDHGRYYADTHGDEGEEQWFVFDSLDDSACCGPFSDAEGAGAAALNLNSEDDEPRGLRPHQVQAALGYSPTL
jgi:hypothetical protein